MPVSSTTVESFVSPEEFREVVLDFEKYPEFLKEVKRVEVKERSDDGALVTFHVEVSVGGLDVKTEYTVRYTIGAKEISWTLDSSPDLTKNDGAWRLEETDDGETRARYESELITSLPIPEEVQKIFADEQLPKMMESFRDRAEGL